MPTGSCLCKNLQYEYTGEGHVIICHCLPCRRLSGSAFSTNILLPRSSFHLTSGTPKTISRPGDSGLDVTLNFCPECGHTIFVTGEGAGLRGSVVVKAGTLDDPELLDKLIPAEEIYTEHKVSWMQTERKVKRPGENSGPMGAVLAATLMLLG
ncbi:hypothetical protein W97_06082 [Coniosporium apollinis CBS 100218]|uniref:CENP-V/GFA domain-containing protein n=1 Tax=Coniosporium apollinis (strain CBS 100218) TaxID=1168221 RepID=R7YZ67_CONA1|nr:uncharacterized protein W97_06082 [Coniosporium apollinis CBS 100218]EON66966.1 hypothetical protein W97_06082 [Coniosporium apollinis CBS 100218]